MTARDEIVTVDAATPAFRVGDIVRADAPLAPEEGGYLVGEVIPTPASFESTGHTFAEFTAALASPETVWVQFRRLVPLPQPVPAGELVRLDTPRAVRGTLELLAKVGITVTRHEVGISPDVAALICDDDEPGEHEHHARSLVLWFESMDDVHALTELTYFGPFEFGCDWPSVYGTDGLRGLIEDGPIIRGVHLADLPVLAGLAERELAGEFGGGPTSIRRRWLLRSARQINLGVVAWMLVILIFFGGLGPFGWAALLLDGVSAVLATVQLLKAGPPRTTLDAVRRRSSKGGPR